jgi:hypothetical protein
MTNLKRHIAIHVVNEERQAKLTLNVVRAIKILSF